MFWEVLADAVLARQSRAEQIETSVVVPATTDMANPGSNYYVVDPPLPLPPHRHGARDRKKLFCAPNLPTSLSTAIHSSRAIIAVGCALSGKMLLRHSRALFRPACGARRKPLTAFVCWQCRCLQISAAPSTSPSRAIGDALGTVLDSPGDVADACFEVLGSPFSMLSVTLSASQKLYTRRGTLVAVSGRPDHARSALSILNPLTRVPFGVPFLYQRITSTTPITALISTKSPTTTFSILHLDGTTDWVISQRNALLAWTGHTLTLSSQIQRRLAVAHWGSTHLSGRGLAALSAPGQIYKVTLGQDEEFVAHPGSVVAYAVSRNAPLPYRFKSSSLRLQVPSLTSWMPDFEFLRTLRNTEAYKFLTKVLYNTRAVTRRTIWGDRLFLHFRGPSTILMSSRGVRIADVLSREQINEIADAPSGVLPAAIEQAQKLTGVPKDDSAPPKVLEDSAISHLHTASVARDGKITFEDGKELKETLR